MANENEKNLEKSEEVYAWIDTIPFSKNKKNLSRDFSDAVLTARILKVYYPRYVDLHNYVPANSLSMKKENWNLLNRRVLNKLDIRLTGETIHQLATFHPGAIENLLLEVKSKIVKNSEQPQTSNDQEAIEDEKNEEHIKEENITEPAGLVTRRANRSTFVRIKDIIFFVISCFINLLCVWNHFTFLWRSRAIESPPTNSDDESSGASRQGIQSGGNTKDEDSIPRAVCAQLRQELGEKDDIISTLNHKMVYLESAMKLKDLRISNLTTQILQNAVETEQLPKNQGNSGILPKARQRIPAVAGKINVEG